MLVLILLLGATAVYGQGHGHGHVHSCIHNNHQQLQEAQVVSMVVADMDIDQDGIVNASEVSTEFLTKYSPDASMRVSEDSFVKQWHKTYHDAHDFAGYLFHHFDLDDDLYLTKSDLDALAKMTDADGDGETTDAEFSAFLTKLYTECVPWKSH